MPNCLVAYMPALLLLSCITNCTDPSCREPLSQSHYSIMAQVGLLYDAHISQGYMDSALKILLLNSIKYIEIGDFLMQDIVIYFLFSKTKDSSAAIAQLDVLKYKYNKSNCFHCCFHINLLEMVQRGNLEMGVKHRRLLSSLGQTLSRHPALHEIWTLLIHFAFNM